MISINRKQLIQCLATIGLLQASTGIDAQDFAGYRAGNYTGVNGVFFNPANIADSRYRWDFNLVAFNSSIGNNQASFKLKDVFNNSLKFDSLKEKVFGNNAGLSSGQVSVNVLGPSVMFNASRHASFALTTRMRAMINIKDMDGKLFSKISNDFENDPSLPYSINSPADMRVTVNGWTEFGLSYGQILLGEGKHFLKAGITLKYLAGAANAYLNLSNFKSTLNQDLVAQDAYMSNTTGGIGIGFGGIKLDDLKAEDLTSFESHGIGADLGLVYEFRPDADVYVLQGKSSREQNKYKLKIGVAVLDIGAIKYTRDQQRSGNYTFDITGNERFYFNSFDGNDIDDYKSVLDSKPQFFTPAASNANTTYKAGLPTTLQLEADYHFNRGFYVNVAGQLSMAKANAFTNRYYNSITATPRYEGRAFGFYLPVNYNELTHINAGVSLRFGPLFVGSGSILSALVSDSKQADAYFGLRFGGLHRKHKSKKAPEDADSTGQ